MAKIQMEGKTFGRLTVVGFDKILPNRHSNWECLCACGNTAFAAGNELRRGKVVSCGCYHREISTKHGMARKGSAVEEATYKSWCGMKDRCTRESNPCFKNYGGRGIQFCARWEHFENFLEDMGVMGIGESLERVDVEGNYEPDNCCWIPKGKQAQNKRNTVWVDLEGEMVCLAEACRRLGLRYGTVTNRVNRLGWSVSEALGR